jgi:hypothetical protein
VAVEAGALAQKLSQLGPRALSIISADGWERLLACAGRFDEGDASAFILEHRLDRFSACPDLFFCLADPGAFVARYGDRSPFAPAAQRALASACRAWAGDATFRDLVVQILVELDAPQFDAPDPMPCVELKLSDVELGTPKWRDVVETVSPVLTTSPEAADRLARAIDATTRDLPPNVGCNVIGHMLAREGANVRLFLGPTSLEETLEVVGRKWRGPVHAVRDWLTRLAQHTVAFHAQLEVADDQGERISVELRVEKEDPGVVIDALTVGGLADERFRDACCAQGWEMRLGRDRFWACRQLYTSFKLTFDGSGHPLAKAYAYYDVVSFDSPLASAARQAAGG